MLIALHHHLKFFVNFVVFSLGPRRQSVIGGVDILTGTVGTTTAVLVLFLVQCLYNVVVSSRLMRLVIFGVFEQHFVHVCGGVLEQLVGAAEDDQSDLAVAQHRQLVGFLHQTELALGECHLSVSFVGDARNLNFFPSHVAVVAAVAVDGGGAADAKLSSAAARASADPSSPSFGHFQNVMSLVQSEILLVLIFLFFVCLFSFILFPSYSTR